MANTTDSVTLTIPITKATRDADGNLYVEGVATNDALDLDEQIIDKDFARTGMQKWFSDWANVRQMHSTSLPPAGKAVEMQELPDGGTWVKTLVVEPTAQKLVEEGVYQAYSVGISKPRIIRDGVAKNGRVVDGVFSEISLVDFPANPTCKFMLAKRAASGDPEVVEKVGPADLAKLATLRKGFDPDLVKASATWYALFKRDMDPDVGGGVDRDKIPDEDFAGEHRSFPIVTPGDVSDAASSIGRAKGQDPAKIKQRIISIAHRKGPKFVAELPDSWKTNEKGASTSELTKGKPDPDCKTCKGSGKIRDGHVDCPDCVQGKSGEPDVAKGRKDCPSCGKSYDGDSSAKHCEDCGHKLPKAAAAEVAKAGTDDSDAKDAKEGLADHPEPDGDEDGPDVDDDGDGKTEKTIAYHLARLHDATCAAFTDTDVLTAHPAVAKGVPAIVDADGFREELNKALADPAPVTDLPGLADAYALASLLKGIDGELAEAAMGEVRKAFADLYPDAHPSPTDVRPGQFKRPYVSAGRAPLSAKAGQHPRIPLSSHVPDAKQFDRGPLTTGHEAVSPGEKPSGKAGDPDLVKRTYYTNAAREQASNLLTAMHDYIAGQHTGVCPMAGPTPTGEAASTGSQGSSLTMATAKSSQLADTRADATPQPVDPASGVRAGAEPDLTKAMLDPEMLKRVIRDTYGLDPEEFATIKTSMDELVKRVQELESQPDPDAAAVRGPAALAKSQTSAGRGDDGSDAPAVEQVVRLVKQARHADSTVSVPAFEKLIKTVGAEQAADLINP